MKKEEIKEATEKCFAANINATKWPNYLIGFRDSKDYFAAQQNQSIIEDLEKLSKSLADMATYVSDGDFGQGESTGFSESIRLLDAIIQKHKN